MAIMIFSEMKGNLSNKHEDSCLRTHVIQTQTLIPFDRFVCEEVDRRTCSLKELFFSLSLSLSLLSLIKKEKKSLTKDDYV